MKNRNWEKFLNKWFIEEKRVSLSKAQYELVLRIDTILDNEE